MLEWDVPQDKKLTVGILVCPGYVPMDVLGTHTVFGLAPNVEMHLVWKDLSPFEGAPRWPTSATTTFADCPHLDVLMVGAIPPPAVGDPEVIEFFREKAEKASAVISVCGGALLLGAAGLLEGRRATSNFETINGLHLFGATAAPGGRVVVDGKFYTAGPVTGSFEAALLALAALRGEQTAKLVELMIEYDPHPPFKTGSITLAGPKLSARAVEIFKPISDATVAATYAAYQQRSSAKIGSPRQADEINRATRK